MADPGPRPDLVLFDLDGTLIQSREAAWEFFTDIASRYGLPFSSAEDFHTIFAGNFSHGLRAACPDEATFEQVKAEYFDLLEREYTPPLVPGMREVVTHLAERTTLGVVSSNVLKVVRRVLETNGIATCIAHVFTGDINPSKAGVITKLRADVGFTLGRHCTPYYDESQASLSDSTAAVYLITDTVGDCEEALASGAIPIGVAWGMHSEDALRRAGADEVCLWPQELVALLGRGPKLGSCALPPAPVAAGRAHQATPGRGGGAAASRSNRSVARGSTPAMGVLDRVRAANTADRPDRVEQPVETASPGCCRSCADHDVKDRHGAVEEALARRRSARVGTIDPEVLAAVMRTARR